MKTCTKCDRALSLDQFHARGATGRASQCRDCCKQAWKDRPQKLDHVAPAEKRCAPCGRILPASEFTKNRYNKTGLHSACRECSSERHKNRITTLVIVPVTEKPCSGCGRILPADSYTKKASNNDGLHSRCKDCMRLVKIERLYKITPERYAEMIQSGCAICGSFDRLVVDHDHACCNSEKSCGKCVRGILCDDHNNGLGRFADDPALLQAAITYLAHRPN